MLLVLTYHRIVERKENIAGFFDVAVEDLERHVALAKRFWGKCLSSAEIAAAADPTANGTRPRVHGFAITFDDGSEDHYRIAAPALERMGAKGIFFVSTALIGITGYVTASQCCELESRGHAVESHGHDHVPLTSLSEMELQRQLGESRRILTELGVGGGKMIAPPGGYFDARVIRSAHACGYDVLRTIEWGYNRRLDPLRCESITVNQQTGGRCCRVFIHPRGEVLKKALYRVKEAVKGTRFRDRYFLLRQALRAGS
jgi:peptidoglycan/xylan/chitin deacetylase (PgdA/CDA1 family)